MQKFPWPSPQSVERAREIVGQMMRSGMWGVFWRDDPECAPRAATPFGRTIAALGGFDAFCFGGSVVLSGGVAFVAAGPHVGKDGPIDLSGDAISLRANPIRARGRASLRRPSVVNIVDDREEQVRLISLVSIEITSSGARVAYRSGGQDRVDLQFPDVGLAVALVGSRVTPFGDVVAFIGDPVAIALQVNVVVL